MGWIGRRMRECNLGTMNWADGYPDRQGVEEGLGVGESGKGREGKVEWCKERKERGKAAT